MLGLSEKMDETITLLQKVPVVFNSLIAQGDKLALTVSKSSFVSQEDRTELKGIVVTKFDLVSESEMGLVFSWKGK